jgi:hypothetical protein
LNFVRVRLSVARLVIEIGAAVTGGTASALIAIVMLAVVSFGVIPVGK